jgi:hypothetical protein
VKLDAQVLATALAVYVTNAALDPTHVAAQYGFLISGDGVGTAMVNVGSSGDAFGVADNGSQRARMPRGGRPREPSGSSQGSQGGVHPGPVVASKVTQSCPTGTAVSRERQGYRRADRIQLDRVFPRLGFDPLQGLWPRGDGRPTWARLCRR